MNELALFAGAGGGILGGKLLGWRTVCAVEFEPHAVAILAKRQNDGILEPFPIWDDVSTFDGKPWKGIIDVVSGGFPCQDISAAGKGCGIKGSRSGLWGEMARIISEVQPKYILVENSPMLTIRGLGTVLGDLAEMGFDAQWGVLGPDNVGGVHRRKRIWIVAYNCEGRGARGENQKTNRCSRYIAWVQSQILQTQESQWRSNIQWESEPRVGRVADGVAPWVDKRLSRIGNGQVPAVVELAWKILTKTA